MEKMAQSGVRRQRRRRCVAPSLCGAARLIFYLSELMLIADGSALEWGVFNAVGFLFFVRVISV